MNLNEGSLHATVVFFLLNRPLNAKICIFEDLTYEKDLENEESEENLFRMCLGFVIMRHFWNSLKYTRDN